MDIQNRVELLTCLGERGKVVCHELQEVLFAFQLPKVDLHQCVLQAARQFSLAPVSGKVHACKQLQVWVPEHSSVLPLLVQTDAAISISRRELRLSRAS